MRENRLFLIISREFLVRVKKKSFIVMTILAPLLFAALIILPSVIMLFSSGEKGREIMVVDRSEVCQPFFVDSESFRYTFDNEVEIDQIKLEFPKELYALVEISPLDSQLNVVVSTYSLKQLNMDAKREIERSVQKGVEKIKLDQYKIENLKEIIEELSTSINAKTYTLSDSGEERSSMVEVNMGIAYVASFMIYMFIFMFGSMVMRGVIEEKSSRIVEVIISSVKPFQLMLGKILGVGSVALLQFFIWIVLTLSITVAAQAIIGVDKLTQGVEITDITEIAGELPMESITATPSFAGELLSALASLPIFTIVISFIIYFLLGYLLYAAMFAAVGSAVDNEADTQQLILPVTLPLILGLFIMIHTFQYPDSSLSFWGSIIPFTSPMVMMARVPFGVPLWELSLSIAVLLLTFLLITYLSAKIYRVGILMYGKKASFKDLYKWIRY